MVEKKYKGVMLIATGQDGNHHQYPVAWVVVDSENDVSWTWFFQKLRPKIQNEEDLAILSDRNRSIINAVSAVYPKAKHGHCRWHLTKNVSPHHGDRPKAELSVLFSKVANAYTMESFNTKYEQLREQFPKAVQYLETTNIKRHQWARSHFEAERYNIMTTNGAESINNAILEERESDLL